VVVSADGEEHQLPFELLARRATGKPLLESHVVSYVPSGSALAMLGTRSRNAPERIALAVSASPATAPRLSPTRPNQAAIGTVARGVDDVDAGKLPPLPSANDEARAVVSMLGQSRSTIVLEATEQEVKRQPLFEYAVLHFAAHGIVSTKFPARSALFLQPGGEDDGLLQAREILRLRLRAELVNRTRKECERSTSSKFCTRNRLRTSSRR
jgi:CHAT domain-containing protein